MKSKPKVKSQFFQCDCGRVYRTSTNKERCSKCEPQGGYPKAFRESDYWQKYMVPKFGIAAAYKQWQAIN